MQTVVAIIVAVVVALFVGAVAHWGGVSVGMQQPFLGFVAFALGALAGWATYVGLANRNRLV